MSNQERIKVKDLKSGDYLPDVCETVLDVSIIRDTNDRDTGMRRVYLEGRDVVPEAVSGDNMINVVREPGREDGAPRGIAENMTRIGSVVEKTYPVRHVAVKAYCTVEGCEGEVKSGAQILASAPPLYVSLCEACGQTFNLTKIYPYVRTEVVED